MATDLVGTVVRTGVAAGTEYYTLGISNVSPRTCTISGPPTIGFADDAGLGVSVSVDNTGNPCGTGVVDPMTCVDSAPLTLSFGAPTPNTTDSPGQLSVTVAIANALNFDPEPTPTYQAHTIVLKFPGASGVMIPLNQDVTLIPSGQVFLHGYGPSS